MSFPFKAVLFDMDGTLTDSTSFHIAAWDAFAQAHLGASLEADDPRLVPGRTLDIVREILGRHVEGEEARLLHDDKELRFHAFARGKMRLIDGCADYLAWLAQGRIPLALVTNAPRINIDFMLPELGLADTFDIVIGAEDVARGKPAPDPFLEACRRLGVAPAEALIHEDSSLGITAGVAAGSPVAAILSGLSFDAALALHARWAVPDYRAWMRCIENGLL